MRQHSQVSEARPVEIGERQSAVFDPTLPQHMESVWFPSGISADPPPNIERLGGFDIRRPRIRVDTVPAARAAALAEYLHRRDELLRSHGGASTVVVESTGTMYGDFTPHLLCFSAWPDEASIDRFEADPRLEIVRRQVEVTYAATTRSRLDRMLHATPEPFEMTFDTRSCYELCALWRGPGWNPEGQQAFFDETVSSRTRHGAGPGLAFEPSGGAYAPDLLCLSEWPSRDHFAAFVDDPEHVEVSRKRDAVFARMDATATRLYSASVTPLNFRHDGYGVRC